MVVQENKGSGIINKKYISVKDVRETFGCSKNKAYKIINTKGFPMIKIGKNYYIEEEAFKIWQRDNMHTSICL